MVGFTADLQLDASRIAAAQARLGTIPLSPDALEQLTRVAHGLAIDSLQRALAGGTLMGRGARPFAAWRGRAVPLAEGDFAAWGWELVLAQRARAVPQDAIRPTKRRPPPEPPENRSRRWGATREQHGTANPGMIC